jgi:glutaminase
MEAERRRPMADVAREAVASPIQVVIDRLHARYQPLRDGQVATYIPELAKADPGWFGICIATTDGQVYETGDTRIPFTIQSISKPFTYGLALEDRGRYAVLEKIGVEPTGDAFNSISLAPESGRPLNPMINAGAIAATSLVAGHSPADRFERLLAVFSLYAGRSLGLDHAVYESERETGHRNRAIGHMLRNFDILSGDPEPALDLYFRQCAIAVSCRDLSVMAATLANGGQNPVTGDRVVRPELVRDILSVMTTCGMYDAAGEWVYWVGMPAKSGVAGGILAVLPGQLGIGVFSPALDERGNSVRGVATCRDLSTELNLHLMRVPRASRSVVRAHYTLAAISSRRRRSGAERRVLDDVGARAHVYELQGDLFFSGVEMLVRRLVETSPAADYAIVDLGRVTAVDETAAGIVHALRCDLAAKGQEILLVGAQAQPRFLRALEERQGNEPAAPPLRSFPDLDQAFEWCEDHLLAERGLPCDPGRAVALAEHELCRGLRPADLRHLEGLLEHRRFRPGELIVRLGDAAAEIYLLVRGEVSVMLDLPGGRRKRLSTLSPGMAFGELAVVNRQPRSADVRADTAVECYALATAAFDRLSDTHPTAKITLLENLLRNVSQMLVHLDDEIAALSA